MSSRFLLYAESQKRKVRLYFLILGFHRCFDSFHVSKRRGKSKCYQTLPAALAFRCPSLMSLQHFSSVLPQVLILFFHRKFAWKRKVLECLKKMGIDRSTLELLDIHQKNMRVERNASVVKYFFLARSYVMILDQSACRRNLQEKICPLQNQSLYQI